MSCEQTHALIHAYLDGELDLVRAMEIEEHMRDCAACARERDNQRALSAAIRNASLYYPVPVGLQRRIHAALAGTVRTDVAEFEPRALPAAPRWIRFGGIAAALALLAVLAWFLMPRSSRLPANDLLAREIVADHVRSLMASHLTDVPSSDQHTVKPWFRGKLDFSPEVKDLSKQGFLLEGGRLDYLQDKPVAALVYRRRQHVINLFVWPSTEEGAQGRKNVSDRGYHVIHWTKSGMAYWAISDINDRELREFVQLFRE